jgi:N-acetylmuramoyl-L-alanine amidase
VNTPHIKKLTLWALISLLTACGSNACNKVRNEFALRTNNFSGDEIQIQDDYWDGFGIKKVLLDPGHGCGQNPAEAKAMWKLTVELAAYLESTGHFKVYKTREHEDTGCENSPNHHGRRGRLAAKKRVDVMLSLHADGPSTTTEGSWFIWTYEQPGLLSQESEWLAVTLGAAFEHEELPIFRMRDSVKPNEVVPTKVRLGYNKYVATHQRYGAHLTQTGLGVLKHSRRPAVLIETHFMDNPTEKKRFENPEYMKKYHRGIALGLLNYFAWTDGRLTTKDQLDEGYWTIQLKATLEKDEAEDVRDLLVNSGLGDLRIETHQKAGQTWYRVRMGNYTQRQALDIGIHSLQVNGWSEYWVDQVRPGEDGGTVDP